MAADDPREPIERLYRSYGRDFSAFDAEAAAGHWHAPSIAVAPDEFAVYPTRADRAGRYADLIEEFRATDYARTEPIGIRVHGLTDRTAVSNVVWHRVTAGGDVITRFSPLHLLRKTAEGWRLVARSSRESDDPMAMSGIGEEGAGRSAGDERVRESVVGFVEAYADVFSTAEPAAASVHWHAPTLLLSPERARVAATDEACERVLDTVFEGLEADDYARSEAAETRVRPLDEGIALADVRWERYDAGGDVFDRFAALLLLRRAEGDWKIATVSRHPVETMLPAAGGRGGGA